MKMIPVIALVGRPNVGKSTLFNRLTRTRDALVADLSGLTRDRKYGQGEYDEIPFIVIDTGGISGDERGIDSLMAEQSLLAIEEADSVVFLVDGRAGLNPADSLIADHLRRTRKNYFLVVNKTDGIDPDVALLDFFSLGVKHVLPIAAAHGRGVSAMMDKVLHDFRPDSSLNEEEQISHEITHSNDASKPHKSIRIAVIGRPNVGKSTLINRLLGENRVVVFDQAGTTRDSIYIPFAHNDQNYTLIDTAGIRRRKNITEAVEKFSIVKTLQAIKDANVVVMMIDAREGVAEHDLHLLSYAIDAGRAIVVAINKWDGMSAEDKEKVRVQLRRKMDFLAFARMHFISALHGSGVGDLFDSVNEAYTASTAKWSTNRLTKLLEDIVAEHQPPNVNGHRIKLRYAHQGGSNPPIIVIHGNQTAALPQSYKRYLENKFIKILNIRGTPIRIEFKTGENPFAGKKNVLSPRQLKKKQRNAEHFKEIKKKILRHARKK